MCSSDLEALSRGAAHCTFVERDRGAIDALRANIAKLGADAEVRPVAAEGFAGGPFDLVDTTSALKVDLFVVGEGLLDRMQLERRVRMDVPGARDGIWVTAAEDQVLRKLDWFRQGASLSDRQWRDVVGILRVHGRSMDLDYLTATARAVGLREELAAALREVEGPGGAS